MRVGSILRFLSIMVLIAGMVLGTILGVTVYATMEPAVILLFWGVVVVYGFFLLAIACLVFAIGTISNNVHEINIKLEDIQFAANQDLKMKRHRASSHLQQQQANRNT